jgi:hypothetical protein
MSQVWRVSPLGRFGVLAFVPILGAFMWIVRESLLFGALVTAAALVAWLRFSFLPAIILTDTEVIVRNPGRTHRIDLSDAVRVEPGYGGLTLTTSTGARVVAWAVQQSNFAKWTGRHTRADEVAASINAAIWRYAQPSTDGATRPTADRDRER